MTEDQFVGCLLGAAVGDSLGAAVEFNTRQEILDRYGGPIVDIEGGYTDDTEMTLALADSIIEKGLVDPENCAASYVKAWSSPPYRGYGLSVRKSLYALSIGVSWKHSGSIVHREGSYGNGGAMRIAPVALTVNYNFGLYKAVENALWCTHTNAEAVEGAFVQALAIQQAGFNAIIDLPLLKALVYDKRVKNAVNCVISGYNEQLSDEDFLDRVCEPNEFGKRFQIRASEAVACSLWFSSKYGPEEAVIQAVNCGGDTDTVGSMTGAIVGAMYGSQWLPTRWLNKLENYETIVKTAAKLFSTKRSKC